MSSHRGPRQLKCPQWDYPVVDTVNQVESKIEPSPQSAQAMESPYEAKEYKLMEQISRKKELAESA